MSKHSAAVRLLRVILAISSVTTTCIAQPTQEDFNESKQKSEGISDHLLKLILENQLIYCPNTESCTTEGRSFNFSKTLGAVPCCSAVPHCHCNYSEDVLYDWLCPDARNMDFSCIRPQLKLYKDVPTFQINTKNGFLMINHCPKSAGPINTRFERLCHVLTPEDNNKPADKDLYELAVYTPVTNSRTNVTYRNIYCAMCSKEDVSDLYPWTATLDCIIQNNIIENSTWNVLRRIFKTRTTCNVLFRTDSDSTLETCSGDTPIFECNTTGIWETYDPDIERACHFYYSPYMDRYRNVFCAMCNGENDLQIQCYLFNYMWVSGVHPTKIHNEFTAVDLVDLVNREKYVTKATRCQCGERYDRLQDNCQKIICHPPLTYTHSSCKGVYEYITSRNYEVYLTIDLRNALDAPCNFHCRHELATNIFNFISHHLFEDRNCFQCQAEMAAELDAHQNGSLNFVIRDIFVITEFHNEVAFVEEFRARTDRLNYTHMDLEFSIDVAPRGRFSSLYYDNFRDKQMVKMFGHEGVAETCDVDYEPFHISNGLLCPMVNISADKMEQRNRLLCLVDIELCFNQSEYEHHTTFALVCEQSYFNGILNTSLSDTQHRQLKDNTLPVDPAVTTLMLALSVLVICVAFCISLFFQSVDYPLAVFYKVLFLSLLLMCTMFVCEAFLLSNERACIYAGYSTTFICIFTLVWLEVTLAHILWLTCASQQPRSTAIPRPSFKRLTVYLCYSAINALILVLVHFAYIEYFPIINVISEGFSSCYYTPSSIFLYSLLTPMCVHLVVIVVLMSLTFYKFNSMNTQENCLPSVKQTREFTVAVTKITFLYAFTVLFGTFAIYLQWVGNFYIFLFSNFILSVYCLFAASSNGVRYVFKKRKGNNFKSLDSSSRLKNRRDVDVSNSPTEFSELSPEVCSHL